MHTGKEEMQTFTNLHIGYALYVSILMLKEREQAVKLTFNGGKTIVVSSEKVNITILPKYSTVKYFNENGVSVVKFS
jgi:hypothetical protein